MEFNAGGFDPPNVVISLSALPVAIPFTVIYRKLDIVHMKNQIPSLFDLWNDQIRSRDKGKRWQQKKSAGTSNRKKLIRIAGKMRP